MRPGHSLNVQMKGGKLNLKGVYYYLGLCVFQFLIAI